MQRSAAQNILPAQHWADSVYSSLSDEERIAQLMVVRYSTMDARTKAVSFFDDKIAALVKKYNIGGICVFQGGPEKQAGIINNLQHLAKTPILMCMDAEWGVGMRLADSVLPLPRQMMLGAMKDETIVYKYGALVAAQCKRFGIQVNYAPVVDVNNNPDNPVINDRSFGEDKYKVAAFGIAYMRGMQDAGVMACAKHFPGHGDVNTDSHYDLPVINKTLAQLDSLELYPFRKIFDAGIGSVMVAHLFIPAIDSTPNRATSLSPQNINGLMRDELKYNGLTFTDALEMQGVKKYYPGGDASVQALIAGNDMLCLPDDVPLAIAKIKAAIQAGKLTNADIEMHCKKLLLAKFKYGLAYRKDTDPQNLSADLNRGVPEMRRLVAENAITLVAKTDSSFFPLRDTTRGDIAFAGFGITADNDLAKRLREEYHAAVFYFGSTEKYNDSLLNVLKHFKKVVIGIHSLTRFPANDFGLTKDMVRMINAVQQNTNNISFLFGNAYAMKNMCTAANMVVCYENDAVVQNTAADLLEGKIFYKGVLPVTVCANLPYGFGIETKPAQFFFESDDRGSYNNKKLQEIDSVANDAIAKHATPGCVVLALKNGKIFYGKAFGKLSYDSPAAATTMGTVYDLASVTKICATTLSVMRLYEEGRLDLHKNLEDYLPEASGTNKANISIEKLLLHEAGLAPFIPFYKETLDGAGNLSSKIYSFVKSDSFKVPVAANLFMKNAWQDTMYQRILLSPRTPEGKYIYSDNDFIFLAKVAERITGERIDDYVMNNFYGPMQLTTIGYEPLKRNDIGSIAPTENDGYFRKQLLRGYVHDQGAAMWGGVAGHAGVFSDAYDIAAVMQMLLNGGSFNGVRYFKKETVEYFTAYHSSMSRRGYGFDKPEKDNSVRKEPYPAKVASLLSFGHTGFTGTCAWADPANGIVYVFLSNRLYPSGSDLLQQMNVRGKVYELLLTALPKAQ